MKIIKAGNVELSEDEALEIYNNKQYVCSYCGIYQPHYSAVNRRVYFTKVIEYKGYARRGRFYVQTAKQINNVLERKILLED